MSATDQLRVRIVDDIAGGSPKRQILVLDAHGRVLGDLSKSVASVTYRMGIAGDVSVAQIEIAVEQASINTIGIPGVNTPAPVPRACTHPAGKACANCQPPGQ